MYICVKNSAVLHMLNADVYNDKYISIEKDRIACYA